MRVFNGDPDLRFTSHLKSISIKNKNIYFYYETYQNTTTYIIRSPGFHCL